MDASDANAPFALRINAFEAYVAPLEILGILSVYVGGVASYDHYTWWSLALVWLYIVLIAVASWDKPRLNISAEALRQKLWLAPFTSAFIVVAGVIIMSAVPCSLLKELYAENGPVLYTGGNFFVHYYPLLRLIFFAPLRFDTEKPLIFVLHLILIYSLAFNPNTIYGCTALPRSVTTFLLAGIPFVFLAASIKIPDLD